MNVLLREEKKNIADVIDNVKMRESILDDPSGLMCEDRSRDQMMQPQVKECLETPSWKVQVRILLKVF